MVMDREEGNYELPIVYDDVIPSDASTEEAILPRWTSKVFIIKFYMITL